VVEVVQSRAILAGGELFVGLLATAHLKYDIIVKTLLVHMQLMCPHMPYLSVHALERSLVHTSVFLHKFIMCASICLPHPFS